MKNLLLGIIGMALLAAALPASADTLDDVKKRGVLKCGLSDRAPGFSLVNAQGKREGFEVDYGDALAAAVFGSAKVDYVPLQPRDAFTTLKSGDVDIFADRAAMTYLRDSSLGFSFATVYFYEGQGFMVPKKANIKSAKELKGATFCSTQGTTYELNLADWAGAQGMQYKVVNFADFEETRRAYEEGRCDVWTADVGNLAESVPLRPTPSWPEQRLRRRPDEEPPENPLERALPLEPFHSRQARTTEITVLHRHAPAEVAVMLGGPWPPGVLRDRRPPRDEREPDAERERRPVPVRGPTQGLDAVVEVAPVIPAGGLREPGLPEHRPERAADSGFRETLALLRLRVGAEPDRALLLAADTLVARPRLG
jgi:ABC-type amino acid transport substrate-binding protein